MRCLRLLNISLLLALLTSALLVVGTSQASRPDVSRVSALPSLERPVVVVLPAPPAVATPVVAVPMPAPVPTVPTAQQPRKPRVVARAVSKPVSRPVAVEVDRYPYRSATTNDHDAWGFTQRQCVSYAAWRLAAAGRSISNDGNVWGSASNWDDAARHLGHRVDARPTVGAIAHWDPAESSTAYLSGASKAVFTAGDYGHVAYVTRVYDDGSVQVAQYNATGNRAFSTMHLTAPRFLLIS